MPRFDAATPISWPCSHTTCASIPRWLAEMVSVAHRHQASAVAAKIVDPTGGAIEFAGGGISFTGHRVAAGVPPPSATAKTADQVLFACVGAGLFSRAAFLDAGGFDEGFFGSGRGSLEDVDLGWRMNTLGHAIIFAAEAVDVPPQRLVGAALGSHQAAAPAGAQRAGHDLQEL